MSHENKFIFIKSRKTAGTSVSAAIAGLCEENDILALSQDVVDLTGISRRNTRIPFGRITPYMFARHDSSTLCVDKVIRFENLEGDLRAALAEAGIDERRRPINLPRLKGDVRAGDGYRPLYSPTLAELADSKFALEKKLFGYEF